MAASGERRRAIEDSNVVETEKTALEDVHAIGIFAIDPPGEVEKQFMEDFFEEAAIGYPADAALDFVDAPGSPGVDRRIYVTKSPLVGGKLPIGMHIPFAEEKDELLLREIRVNEREGDAVKAQVPGRIPGILPFVRHGDDVVVIEVGPLLVAAFQAIRRRRRTGGIAFEPGTNVIVIKLLGPQQAAESLAHDVFRVARGFRGDARGVEFIGLLLAECKDVVEAGAEI